MLERIAQFLRLDGAELTRKFAQVVIIWLLAWAAMRLTRLAARRIERLVDDGDAAVTTLREKRGITIAQPGSQWDVARELRRRLKKRLDAEGLEIPFPQRKVHVKVEGPAGPAGATEAAAAAGGA